MRCATLLVTFLFSQQAFGEPPDFDKQIAPLLIQHCMQCHSGTEAKGKLNLMSRATAREVIEPGKADQSEAWLRVAADEMPPKKPLSKTEKDLLKAWIDAGAVWGSDPIDPFSKSNAYRAGRDWWSLQELPSKQAGTNRTIDEFIRAKLKSKGLKPSPPADPRSQIRRLYFDLIGLPPPFEVMESFAKNPTDAAYERIVDQLLASHHYGERWARHWLDVVRYGESDSFERNEPRPNAWHYRDWLIRALNDDMPYDRFAKLQLAGDALEPENPESVKATGFLVAGIHNTVLGSNAAMRATARQDELEDIISAVSQTFLGLTAQCARCHDHKFDPITQADYYRISAALGGVFHGERSIDPPVHQKRRAAINGAIVDLEQQINQLEAMAVERAISQQSQKLAIVQPVARWSFQGQPRDTIGGHDAELKSGARITDGMLVLDGKSAHAMSAPLKKSVQAKTLEAWVSLARLDQGGGGAITLESSSGAVFDSIVFAERQSKRWMAGSNNFARTKDFNGPEETEQGKAIHLVLTTSESGEVRLYRNGKLYGQPYQTSPPPVFKAGDAHVAFGMRHKGGSRAFLGGAVDEARLYDRVLTAAEVKQSFEAGPDANSISREEILQQLTATERKQFQEQQKRLEQLKNEMKTVPKPYAVYATNSKAVPQTFVLARGDVRTPKAEVTAGGIASVGGGHDFGLHSEAAEPLRRKRLAEWIARSDNPLFARVIVNRLWHYHFGVGIVDTPSDFGFNGGRPSHPELLDWLAGELIRRNWSLKAMHKLMVMSTAYRQSSAKRPDAGLIDAENRLLWRKSPARLEAEAIRDSILSASGQLNPQIGGAPFHDVRTYGNAGTKYYEPIDPVGAEFNRRTIYRFSPRGERSAILETFDCPESSALTPRRQVTTTPLQALALWNDHFVLRMSKHLEERILAKGSKSISDQVEQAYHFALSRAPTQDELNLGLEYCSQFGLSAFARVLFNCNEFVVIE